MAAPKSSIPPGTVFGFLTVTETLAGTKKTRPRIPPRLRCLCVCGNAFDYSVQEIKKGYRQSCGCRPNEHQRTCAHCGAPFTKYGKFGPEKFCSVECRFWSKVDRSSPDSCWLWTGAHRIYGTFQESKANAVGKFVDAHRFAWRLVHGPIDAGLLVCHRCDNPLCCNPAHLFLGTGLDNMQDMVRKGRHRFGANRTGAYEAR